MFNRYYQTELTYLREMGAAFAEAHPGLAGMLAERGGDPDVERLLEGFAFLTGRIRQRIDDAVPEFIEGLAELSAPHMLRPVPACSILQFAPSLEKMRARQTVAAGTRVHSRRVRATVCEFRTSFDIDLLPLSITNQRFLDGIVRAPRIELELQVAPGGSGAVFTESGFELHLHDERGIAAHLWMWLTRHLRSVSVRAPDGREWALPQRSVRVRSALAQSLWPWPDFSSPGLRVLLEYFTLSPRFFFFQVGGLSAVREAELERFTLAFGFDAPPPLPARPSERAFQLHCVPVTNLFEADAEPITVSPPARKTLLRAQGVDPAHAEVFAVRGVSSIAAGTPPREHASFYGFRHGAKRDHDTYYVVSRQPSPVDEGMHHFLELHQPTGTPPDLAERIVSTRLLCTNRSLPLELVAGDIRVPTASSPTGVPFQNIGTVTPPRRAPLGQELLWRVIAYLAASQRHLGATEVLKSLLSLHNLQGLEDTVVGRANEARIEAIRSVRSVSATRVLNRAPIRGVEYQVEVNEGAFASVGDACLFGEVLAQLLDSLSPVNGFADLRFTLFPSKFELRWDASTTNF